MEKYRAGAGGSLLFQSPSMPGMLPASFNAPMASSDDVKATLLL